MANKLHVGLTQLRLAEVEAVASAALKLAQEKAERGPQGQRGESIVGPQGPAGRDGKDSTVAGPPGRDAENGRNGRDGKDSTVAGPPGRDGKNGRDGKDADTTEIHKVMCELMALRAYMAGERKGTEQQRRVDLAACQNMIVEQNEVIQQLRNEVAEVKLLLQGFMDLNLKTKQYCEWLRERAKDRRKGRT